MQPHSWHAVFTVSNALTVGGQFLSYENMRRTMIGRAFDVYVGLKNTNQNLRFIEWSIVLMARAPTNRPVSRSKSYPFDSTSI
jgi:hypothetical protein